VARRTNAERGRYFSQRKRQKDGVKRLSLHSCSTCGKQCFETRHLAKTAAGRIAPGMQIRLYLCGGFWHHTSVPAAKMGEYRERDYRRALNGQEHS
jgi:hypothetical protein